MKKRSVSLLLVLCLMFSVCSLCFVSTASAKTVDSYTSLVSLTFDGNEPFGIPFHRKVTSVKYENDTVVFEKSKNNGGTAWIGKDGSVGEYLWEYLTQIGMPATSGNYSHADYSNGSATVEDIVNNLTSDEIPHGSVILNHSTKTSGVTPDALEQVLPILYEKGYRFCTLTQLFELQGIDYEDIPTDGHIKRVYVENGEAVYEYRDK